jgi:hypothetical protein
MIRISVDMMHPRGGEDLGSATARIGQLGKRYKQRPVPSAVSFHSRGGLSVSVDGIFSDHRSRRRGVTSASTGV